MNILVANDDGIESPGLLALVDQLSEIGDVYVVAPNVQQSGKSHAFTFNDTVRYEQRNVPNTKKAFALWGTPADCVHIGLEYLIKEKMDLVVSGINVGKNAGSDVIYSGTCGAAREGMLMGIPSIAVSLNDYSITEYDDFRYTACVAKEVARKYMESKPPCDYFLNINVPYIPENEIKGIKICDSYGYVMYCEEYTEFQKDGKTYINIKSMGHKLCFDTNDNNIEASACLNGYISIAPLMADQIDHRKAQKLVEQFNDFTI